MPDFENLEEYDPGDSSRSVEGLTQREDEVPLLVSGGKSNRRIAEELAISAYCWPHLSDMFDKIGVSSRTAASTLARDLEFV